MMTAGRSLATVAFAGVAIGCAVGVVETLADSGLDGLLFAFVLAVTAFTFAGFAVKMASGRRNQDDPRRGFEVMQRHDERQEE